MKRPAARLILTTLILDTLVVLAVIRGAIPRFALPLGFALVALAGVLVVVLPVRITGDRANGVLAVVVGPIRRLAAPVLRIEKE